MRQTLVLPIQPADRDGTCYVCTLPRGAVVYHHEPTQVAGKPALKLVVELPPGSIVTSGRFDPPEVTLSIGPAD